LSKLHNVLQYINELAKQMWMIFVFYIKFVTPFSRSTLGSLSHKKD